MWYNGRDMNLLQRFAAFLAKWTPAVVALAAVISYFLPGTFGWVRGNAQTSLLGLIMLTMGLTLTGEDFRILAARPFDIAIGTLAQFTLMPLIAYGLVHGLGLPKEAGVGLILVGCCPGGVSSNIMSFLCKGDVAFSVGMTTLSTLAAPVMTPFLMLWLARESVDVDAVGMFSRVHRGRRGLRARAEVRAVGSHDLRGGVLPQLARLRAGVSCRCRGQVHAAEAAHDLDRGGHAERGAGHSAGWQALSDDAGGGDRVRRLVRVALHLGRVARRRIQLGRRYLGPASQKILKG